MLPPHLRHRVHDHPRGPAKQQHIPRVQPHGLMLLFFKRTLVRKLCRETDGEADDGRRLIGPRHIGVLAVL